MSPAGRSRASPSALLSQKFDDKALVLADKLVGKPLLRQEVAEILSPVRIVCLQLGELGRRLVSAIEVCGGGPRVGLLWRQASGRIWRCGRGRRGMPVS